jgi:hypothetical protein
VRGADPLRQKRTHAQRPASGADRHLDPRIWLHQPGADRRREDGIIAGDGRVRAAHLLGLDEVPCIVLAHLTPTQRRAYVLAEGRMATQRLGRSAPARAHCQHDPAGRLGSRLARLFRIGFKPGEEVSARLEAIDRDPARIDLIINSHFHFDHVGGNALIPNATMLVQRREWDAGMDPDTATKRGFNPRDFDLGHKLRLVDGEHDVFGDGSVVCLPTHGHTPGHQSLKLQLDSGEIALATGMRLRILFEPATAR